MLSSAKKEVLEYDEGLDSYYRVSYDFTDYEFPRFGITGLKVGWEECIHMSWEGWRDYDVTAEFDVALDQKVTRKVLSELAFLTLVGAETGYDVQEIKADYDSVTLKFNNRSLSRMIKWIQNIECCTPQFENEINLTLPVRFVMRLHTQKPGSEAKRRLPFVVMMPRQKPSKNGKPKWRKFKIFCNEAVSVEECRKRYRRETIFLEPTQAEIASHQRPVLVREKHF